ncbi:tRNA (adenosine(37)-N6)-threonylcarbamoyltransferase complex transferase subunit TsaD [Candidatus Parcubacteria bacterium]|nr:MAG: tRNA (adenosine(37)-N6)-threonylcarbamoyltransferase complex transferase subunit TsaD [Candidatus Parcubacteria bacterium]
MRILGIETSCDETAIAVIEATGTSRAPRIRVLSNVVSSQMKLHAKFGGVVPNLAKREHQRNLVPVLLQALRESRIMKHESRKRVGMSHDSQYKILDSILEREPELFAAMQKRVVPFATPDIDAIAVTAGPGLAPALWVGVNFARALSFLWKKPLIPINHLEGHIYTNLIPKDADGGASFPLPRFRYPALCLIVSGGHTELALMPRAGTYRIVGETRDDAAGEAFDKVAKMMNLGFPGGPIISRLAERGNTRVYAFPRPMIRDEHFDFSFSGLKTAVLYTIRDMKKLGAKEKRDIAASFEQAAVDVLVAKTVRAAKKFRARTVMIGGGVAANKKLRETLRAKLAAELPRVPFLVPHVPLTGDNALMIALAGFFNTKKKSAWNTVQADANLRLG